MIGKNLFYIFMKFFSLILTRYQLNIRETSRSAVTTCALRSHIAIISQCKESINQLTFKISVQFNPVLTAKY